MKTVNAFIERGSDGHYSVYIDHNENSLTYGIHGTGDTAKEAIDDFKNSYYEMKEFYREIEKEFTDAEFNYQYDIASFLAYYSNVLTLSGLSRLTGINQGLLSHYVNGRKNPTKRTIEKIETSIHSFGKELSQVQFI